MPKRQRPLDAFGEGLPPQRRRHGLTPGEQAALLRAQGYVCAVCGTTDPGSGWVIEHDHDLAATHRHPVDRGCRFCIRGVTCGSCNSMLAFAHDRPEVLEAGAAYIRRNRVRLGA